MKLYELKNMCRNESICIYGNGDKYIDTDEGVSEYLIKYYGDCEVLDMAIGQDDDYKPFLAIYIDDNRLKR